MDLICSEPSPSSPTDNFLKNEKTNKSLVVNSSPISNGFSISGHYLSVSQSSSEPYLVTNQTFDQLNSPLSTHSDASSGYESMVNTSPSVDGEVNFDNLEQPTRIPRQMLQIEFQYVPRAVDTLVYLCKKYEPDEKARRIVTEWMLEVGRCEE